MTCRSIFFPVSGLTDYSKEFLLPSARRVPSREAISRALARSLALLSRKKYKGLLVVYPSTFPLAPVPFYQTTLFTWLQVGCQLNRSMMFLLTFYEYCCQQWKIGHCKWFFKTDTYLDKFWHRSTYKPSWTFSSLESEYYSTYRLQQYKRQ